MDQKSDKREAAVTADGRPPEETCDVCGSSMVSWRKCKLICLNCGTILKSCADL